MKKLSIALTVAAMSSGAFAQGGNGGVAGNGGNGGAIVEDVSRGSLAPNMRSGGNAGAVSAGGNGGAGATFDEWDIDRNGVLSQAEALRAGFTEVQFVAMDTDRDGRVTLKEFTVASITPQR